MGLGFLGVPGTLFRLTFTDPQDDSSEKVLVS